MNRSTRCLMSNCWAGSKRRAARKGCIKAIAHSQAPEMPKRGIRRAKGPLTCPALRETRQIGKLLVREGGVGDDGGLRQQDSLTFDHESDKPTLSPQAEGLLDRFRQMQVAISLHFSGDN